MSNVASFSMSVIGKGDEEGLRHVEKDVLIPKKMKAKAMKLCRDYVKGKLCLLSRQSQRHIMFVKMFAEFEDCVRGRTVSAAWHCQKESKKMQECFAK